MNRDDLLRTVAVLQSLHVPWWIAGGWAIDLQISREIRPHGDLDIAVLRRDQRALQRDLSGWTLLKMVRGVRTLWSPEEWLSLPVHEVHASRDPHHLEFLFNEAEGDTWMFRRNVAVRMPLAQAGRRTADGLPYLCPEIVLLYKAKRPRAVDHDDFERVLPFMQNAEKRWLSQALDLCHPEHAWLARLSPM
jgi:hypothetical protein